MARKTIRNMLRREGVEVDLLLSETVLDYRWAGAIQ